METLSTLFEALGFDESKIDKGKELAIERVLGRPMNVKERDFISMLSEFELYESGIYDAEWIVPLMKAIFYDMTSSYMYRPTLFTLASLCKPTILGLSPQTCIEGLFFDGEKYYNSTPAKLIEGFTFKGDESAIYILIELDEESQEVRVMFYDNKTSQEGGVEEGGVKEEGDFILFLKKQLSL